MPGDHLIEFESRVPFLTIRFIEEVAALIVEAPGRDDVVDAGLVTSLLHIIDDRVIQSLLDRKVGLRLLPSIVPIFGQVDL